MNEEEKQAVKDFEDLLKKHFEETSVTSFNFLDGVEGIHILNIIKKQQKVIEKQQKEIEKRLKEIDSLYKMMSAKDDRIEGLTELVNKYNDMQYIRKVEENYISKDKIEAKIEKIKEDEKFYRERDRMYEFNGKINILKELLGE